MTGHLFDNIIVAHVCAQLITLWAVAAMDSCLALFCNISILEAPTVFIIDKFKISYVFLLQCYLGWNLIVIDKETWRFRTQSTLCLR